MRRIIVIIALCLLTGGVAWGHLCNDVFIQAKDNLAVKVDIRDGQLRIGKEASFKVYLLNTMDRAIVNINLEVITDKFTSTVKPSPAWKSFPSLKHKSGGGKKEYFTVELKRKKNVRDGRYPIKLCLFNGQKRSMEFKTVEISDAASCMDLCKEKSVKVDGRVTSSEWKKGLVCDGFYTYEPMKSNKRYYENVPAREQARVRIMRDDENLYVLMTFQGGKGASSDAGCIYLAKTVEDTPMQIRIDRISGSVKASAEGVEEKIKVAVTKKKSDFECRVPLSVLGIDLKKNAEEGEEKKDNTDEVKSIYVNFTRTTKAGENETTSYWRGNKFSATDPVEYVQLRLVD